MPTPSRQLPNSSGRPRIIKRSIIDDIAPVKARGAIRLCVYGRGKTGKTRFASTFPKPVLIIGTEDGTKSVSGIPDVFFIRIKSSDDFAELIQHAKETRKYSTLVLDTGGGFQDIIVKEVLGLEDTPIQKSWGMARQQDWMVVGEQWKERMRHMLNLADFNGINVVVIAHERNFKDEGVDSELLTPTVGAALSPKTAAWLNAECDYICQTFIREETKTKTTSIGEGKAKIEKTIQVRTGKNEYCLRVGPHSVYTTGFRLPPGVVLPDAIVDPHYDKIMALINPETQQEEEREE